MRENFMLSIVTIFLSGLSLGYVFSSIGTGSTIEAVLATFIMTVSGIYGVWLLKLEDKQ